MVLAASLEPFLADLSKDSLVRRLLLNTLTMHRVHVLMIDREALAGLTMTKTLLTSLLLCVVLLAQVDKVVLFEVSRSIILLVACLVLLETASRR